MTLTTVSVARSELTDLVAAVRQVMVWLPGQSTRIHDHITWCVVGVLAGVEHEELFDESLNPVGVRDARPGEVSGFASPGDIHRIRNDGSETAISLHIYGTDISRVGTGARRYYD